MLEYLIIVMLGLYYVWEVNNSLTKVYDPEKGFVMSQKDAAVIVVLKDIDKNSDVYYVARLFNPESSLATQNYFTDFIFKADCYESREKAISRAKQIDLEHKTQYGVLVYDGLQDYTFGEAVTKFNSKRYVS